MSKVLKLITSVIVCETIGLAAIPFTISAIPNWYANLNKPSFSPPNWIFGPVWTVLYLMMGISAYLIWSKGLKNKKVRIALNYFLIQLFLNFLWSIFFFGLRSPLFGFIEIIILWLVILLTINKFYKISSVAAWLLLPYLLWVSFAAFLNLSVIILNP